LLKLTPGGGDGETRGVFDCVDDRVPLVEFNELRRALSMGSDVRGVVDEPPPPPDVREEEPEMFRLGVYAPAGPLPDHNER